MDSILITGGSGFFGRAFVEECFSRSVERICIFSRGEALQAKMRSELLDHKSCRWFIGDVRDRWRLRRALEGVEVVVHAAALKRVEVGEYNHSEMVRTNIAGAENLIEASIDSGVKKVVMISTDKAVSPVNCYGATKLVAEKLVLAGNSLSGNRTKFSVVRYGNVWGSTGSVVPTWKTLIERGETEVPVTSPFATRFFMTKKQAVDLVWETIETMNGGELVMPELPAYELSDLAHAMGVRMKITGLPKHEKVHETMGGIPSDLARRMSVKELKEALNG